MGQRLNRFFAGTTKPMRVALLGFVVGLCGVALAFSIDYGPANRLSWLAFGIGILGWVITMAGIAWDWYTMGRRRR